MDALAEINALREQLDALEKLAKEDKTGPHTKQPITGTSYFFLDSRGKPTEDTWEDHEVDEGRWRQGNVFRTHSKASTASAARTAVTELLRQPGRVPYEEGTKSVVIIVTNNLSVTTRYSNTLATSGLGGARFVDEDAANAAVRAVGHSRLVELALWESQQ